MELDNRRKQAIERFVRDVLGCQCHEEVFRLIEAGTGTVPSTGVRVNERIVIGRKLLIYTVDTSGGGCRPESVETLVNYGISDRDRHGLNRFRLVLASDLSEEVAQEYRKAFQALSLPDSRVHLHIVSHGALP